MRVSRQETSHRQIGATRTAPAPTPTPAGAALRRIHLVGSPALLVEARFRGVTLATRLMRADAPASFAIGATARVDAPVNPAYLPSASAPHPLVEAEASGARAPDHQRPETAAFAVDLTPAMAAEVWGDFQSPAPLPSTEGEVALAPGTTLRIWCGEVLFDLQPADPVDPLPRPWLPLRWQDDAPYPLGVGILLLALLAVIRASPGDPRALSLDDIGASTRFDRVLIMPPEVNEPEASVRTLAWLRKQGGSSAPAAAGPSGSAGRAQAKPLAARVSRHGETAPRDAAAEVRSISLLALLDGSRSSALAATLAKGPAMGSEVREVLAHLDGANLVDGYGHGGLGSAGTGAKAAGTNEGTLGGGGPMGTWGRFGHGGPGQGVGDPYGAAAGGLGTRKPRPIGVFIEGHATVRGSLDKDIIRRIVRRHLNEVRYCYEQGLARRPGLSGRLVVQFTIAPNGSVLRSLLASSSTGAVAVDACVVAAVRRWAFPAPSGGGLVMVSYPFELTPAGG